MTAESPAFMSGEYVNSICVELETEFGNLLVYGMIIGISGNRNKNFKIDLLKQIEDFKILSEENICIVGDFNCSFSDNYYFTNFGRDNLLQVFSDLKIELLTKNCAEWNLDRKLSDHKGIFVDF